MSVPSYRKQTCLRIPNNSKKNSHVDLQISMCVLKLRVHGIMQNKKKKMENYSLLEIILHIPRNTQDSGNGKYYLDYSCPYTCWHATCVSNTQYLFLGLLLESVLVRRCWRHVAIWIDINHNHSSISSEQPVMRVVQHVSACHISTLVIHFLYYVSLQICNNQQKRCNFYHWHEDSEYTSTFYAVWQSNKKNTSHAKC